MHRPVRPQTTTLTPRPLRRARPALALAALLGALLAASAATGCAVGPPSAPDLSGKVEAELFFEVERIQPTDSRAKVKPDGPNRVSAEWSVVVENAIGGIRETNVVQNIRRGRATTDEAAYAIVRVDAYELSWKEHTAFQPVNFLLWVMALFPGHYIADDVFHSEITARVDLQRGSKRIAGSTVKAVCDQTVSSSEQGFSIFETMFWLDAVKWMNRDQWEAVAKVCTPGASKVLGYKIAELVAENAAEFKPKTTPGGGPGSGPGPLVPPLPVNPLTIEVSFPDGPDGRCRIAMAVPSTIEAASIDVLQAGVTANPTRENPKEEEVRRLGRVGQVRAFTFSAAESWQVDVAMKTPDGRDVRQGVAEPVRTRPIGAPPDIRIASPTDGSLAKTADVTVRFSVSDDQGVRKVEGFLDDTPVFVLEGEELSRFGDGSRAPRAAEIERRVNLGENNGRRRLQIAATDLEDQRVTREVSFDQVFLDFNAIVVGVTTYEQAAPVSFADKDAQAVSDTLIDRLQYDKRSVTLLQNADASGAKLRSAFAALAGAGKTKAEGTVVVWFSGQVMEADGEVYLLPADADPARLAETALSVKKLGEALGKIRAKRKILIVDAAETPAGFGRALGGLADCVTIAGGSDGDLRDSDRDLELGRLAAAFRSAVTEGDANKDGLVSADEVFTHVRKRVKEDSFDGQTPALVSQGGTGRAAGYFFGRTPPRR